MIKELITIANELDSRGLVKEADLLDEIIVKQSGWRETALDWGQAIADVAGLVPFYGEFIDIANASVSMLRGDKVNAALSSISIIPIAGDIVGKGAKLLFHAISRGLKTVKLAGTSYSMAGLAMFLEEQIKSIMPEITAALNKLDEKVGAEDFKFIDVFNNEILKKITDIAAAPPASGEMPLA